MSSCIFTDEQLEQHKLLVDARLAKCNVRELSIKVNEMKSSIAEKRDEIERLRGVVIEKETSRKQLEAENEALRVKLATIMKVLQGQ